MTVGARTLPLCRLLRVLGLKKKLRSVRGDAFLSVLLSRDCERCGAAGGAVEVKAPESQPLPLPIILPPLTAVQAGQQEAPVGAKIQQLGLPSWNLDRCFHHPAVPLP